MTGACLSRAGFNRKTALATVTMVIAAEAADLDVLWGFKSSVAGLQHHRGWTHSFLGAPVIAAASLGAVYLWYRGRALWRKRRMREVGAAPSGAHRLPRALQGGSIFSPRHIGSRLPRIPARWRLLYLAALIASLSHLLLDYTTAYGIRLFEPFSFRWYSWDIVYIIDPLLWLVLLAGLILPAFFAVIHQEIGAREKHPRGRVGAIVALALMVTIWAFRDYEHRRAIQGLESLTYMGAEPIRTAAYPHLIDPFHWHGLVETADFFQTIPVHAHAENPVYLNQAKTFYKPEETPITLAAKSSEMGRVYLDWAVFPIPQTEQVETRGGTMYLVLFEDLRYADSGIATGSRRPPLTAYVLLGPDLKVLQQGMNSSKAPTVESLQRRGAP